MSAKKRSRSLSAAAGKPLRIGFELTRRNGQKRGEDATVRPARASIIRDHHAVGSHAGAESLAPSEIQQTVHAATLMPEHERSDLTQ